MLLIGALWLSMAACWRSQQNENTNNTNTADSPFANITDAGQALAEGNRLFDENQIELAIEAYLQAVKLNPDLAEAWFKLGIAYALVEKQLQQSGNYVEQTNANGGRVKPDSERAFEKAVEAYKKWVEANPNDDAAFYNLGRAYAKLLKDEEAEKAFRQAVKLKPEDADYLTELGAMLIRLAKYHEALDPLKKAVDLDPENIRAQELLEDAEAGRQRLDYVQPKNTNSSAANSNSIANANVSSNSNSAGPPRNTNSGRRIETNVKNPPANRPPR